jgi:DNA-binding transcriptional MerR regulator
MSLSKKAGSRKSGPGLKMKTLVEATGVPKSTILHYLHQGLLPEPVKTSPNMAYYDPGCIDLIKFIRHMQKNQRLSLSQIRRRLEGKVEDPGFSIHLELHDLIFGKAKQEKLLDEKDFCKATGLTEGQVSELKKARLLMPLIDNRFDQEDVQMGQMYARAQERGLTIEDTTYYVKYGEKIVDHEMALRRRVTHHLPWDQDASRTMDLVRNARMLRAYIIDRLFQHRVAAMRGIKDSEDGSC